MTKCEVCQFKTKVQADSGCRNSVVDWCLVRSRPLFWVGGKYVGCAEGKLTLRGKISQWWEKLKDSQVTEYEKHLGGKRG